jgi:phosphatidylserine/phosphatidylglycerophosphate/cardiolipin synthase-like enzyme
MPIITLTPAPRTETVAGTKATFLVGLQGFTVGQELELSFVERADGGGQPQDRVLGTARGRVAMAAGISHMPMFTLIPAAPPPPPPAAVAGQPPPVLVAFRLTAPIVEPGRPAGAATTWVLPITNDHLDVNEGDWWEFEVRCAAPQLQSAMVPIARIRRQLDARGATYDWHGGNTTKFYGDGSADMAGSAGAFKDVLDAIAAAQHFVFIADWSFHPMFAPTHGPTMADTIGAKLIAKAASALVAVHTWDHTNIAAPDPQNDGGDDVFDLQAGGTRPGKLLWRASSHDQTGMSHHQKYVLLDAPGPGGRRVLKAFFGGLDLTQGRFDWGEHPFLPSDPRCAKFRTALTLDGESYNDWYNGEFGGKLDLPREPWHDIHGMIEGPAAWDFVREFVGRWNVDPSWVDAMGDDGSGDIEKVLALFKSLFDPAKFVQQWEPHGGPWDAQVCRSMFRSHWAESEATNTPARRGTHREFQWRVSGGFERSIQLAYRQAIDQAEKFVYIESQYLIGSGRHWGRSSIANTLPERLVERIKQRIRDGVPFHVYVVMPMFPEGVPNSVGLVAVRQYEWKTMEYMAKAIHAEAQPRGKDWRDYVSFCFLANWNTVPAGARRTTGTREQRVRDNQRYMIYVHSKLMIVDDRYVLFGSANLNERSLAGDRDLEIACAMWPARGREAECQAQAKAFRLSLWAEHFGPAMPAGASDPESAACVASVRAKGRSNYMNFRQLTRGPTDGHLCIWPFHADTSAFYVESVSTAPEGDLFLPDGVYNEGSQGSRYEWLWHSPGWHVLNATGIAE